MTHLGKYTSFTESGTRAHSTQAVRLEKQNGTGSKIALKSEDVLSKERAHSFFTLNIFLWRD